MKGASSRVVRKTESRRSSCQGSPEEIARGELAGAQGFVKQSRLRAFADPRRTKQD